jgi:hypothetical protein
MLLIATLTVLYACDSYLTLYIKVKHNVGPRRYRVSISNKRTLQQEIDSGSDNIGSFIAKRAKKELLSAKGPRKLHP